MGRSWTADIPGLKTTTSKRYRGYSPEPYGFRLYRALKWLGDTEGTKSPVCTAYAGPARVRGTATTRVATHRTPCTTCTTGNEKKEKRMGTLRQLASSLGLSSEPRPAPPTPPIRLIANDSSIPAEQPGTGPARHIVTAATASNEWCQARDQYLNHLMACRACYAPTGRHCAAGSALSQQYRSTPMESLDEPERTAGPRPVSQRSPALAVSLVQPRG